MPGVIPKDDLLRFIAAAKMPYKSVTFIKRTNQDVRHMIFRLPGETPDCGKATPLLRTLDDLKANKLTVWDCNKADYRCVSFEHVEKVIIDNDEYTIEY